MQDFSQYITQKNLNPDVKINHDGIITPGKQYDDWPIGMLFYNQTLKRNILLKMDYIYLQNINLLS